MSLPGVVAARCGAVVILSDAADRPACLENCRRSCEANDLSDVPVVGVSWGEISPDLVLLPELDVILGSDIFYDPEGSQHIFLSESKTKYSDAVTLSNLIDRNFLKMCF